MLIGHSLRRVRAALIVLAILLAGFQFLLTQVAAYLMRRNGFSQLSDFIPDFIRTAVGPEGLAFMSFGGVVSLGYFHPIVMTALVGLTIAIATETTGEIEMRFVDFTLARPLGRQTLVIRTIVVLVVAGALMLLTMMAGTWIGLSCCVPADADPPSARRPRAAGDEPRHRDDVLGRDHARHRHGVSATSGGGLNCRAPGTELRICSTILAAPGNRPRPSAGSHPFTTSNR